MTTDTQPAATAGDGARSRGEPAPSFVVVTRERNADRDCDHCTVHSENSANDIADKMRKECIRGTKTKRYIKVEVVRRAKPPVAPFPEPRPPTPAKPKKTNRLSLTDMDARLRRLEDAVAQLTERR